MFRCLRQIDPLSTGVLMKHTPMVFTLSVALMALSLTSCGSGIDTEEEALPWCKEDVCDEGGASLLKCDIDTGRTTLKLCPFGCSNGTCKVSPTAECFTNADCPATKPVCASGTCIANDTPAPPAPECNINSDCPAAKPVCSNGTCIANDTPAPPVPECNINSDCPAAKPVCSNGTCIANDTPAPPAPECNINSDCPATKPVCSNGKCIENSTVADVACHGVTCAKGTCDRGICVTDEMKAAKEGDPCDDNFDDFCRGDSMVFCSMANKVVVESCAQDGGCAIVNEKLQGGDLLLSWCNGPSDQCKTEGQKIPFCTSDADGKSFESSFVCAKNTEGKFTAKDQLLLGEYSPCAATCNADNTACDNSTPAPECKTNNDCKDPTKPVCSNGTCVANDTPEPPAPECKTNNDCKDPTKPVCSNGTCVANDTPEPPAPECKTHDDCKDKTKPVCDNGKCIESSTVVDVACQGVTCAKGTCDRGVCVTDEMKAVKEGDPCDGKTFGDFCNGDSMVYCSTANKVVVTDCSNEGGCSIIKGSDGKYSSWCNGPSNQCKNDDQKIPYCGLNANGYLIESSYICIKNTEGKFTALDQALYQGGSTLCATKCNADNTACDNSSTDYNKPCDNSFKERCDGNIAVYCNSSKKITPLPCDSTESCYLSKADNNANCFDDAYIAEQSCTQLNHEKMVCDRESYEHHALVTYKCGSLTKYDNTSTIQVYFFAEGLYCNNGIEYTSCNADNTACQ